MSDYHEIEETIGSLRDLYAKLIALKEDNDRLFTRNLELVNRNSDLVDRIHDLRDANKRQANRLAADAFDALRSPHDGPLRIKLIDEDGTVDYFDDIVLKIDAEGRPTVVRNKVTQRGIRFVTQRPACPEPLEQYVARLGSSLGIKRKS